MKEILSKLKLQLMAGAANPSPPIGPMLGQYGVNIVNFCKEFNNLTKNLSKDLLINLNVIIFKDKTFLIKIKGPSVSFLIKKLLNIEKGSNNSKKEKVGCLTITHINEIIKLKQEYFNTLSYNSMIKMIKGTAISMGLKIND